MVIKELLNIFDFTNIETFTLNGVPYSLHYISNILGDEEVLGAGVYTENKELHNKDLMYSIDTDQLKEDTDVGELLHIELPNTTTYVSITFNIKIREEVLQYGR